MRPDFEAPLDTAKQLVEKNISLFGIPGTQIWLQHLLESPKPEYYKLGEKMVLPNSVERFYEIVEHDVIGNGTHALLTATIGTNELSMGRWHRSEEKLAGVNPYVGYLTNKKWHLNEVRI